MKDLASQVVAIAKGNVAPGKGPGPHPHREDHGWVWEDTGTLMESITWGFEDASAITNREAIIALIYADATKAPYGQWLELGWHGPSGQFYRYPFL